MIQVIKTKCCGKVFAACVSPQCYTEKDWTAELRKYVLQGCTVDLVEDGNVHFELCECDTAKDLFSGLEKTTPQSNAVKANNITLAQHLKQLCIDTYSKYGSEKAWLVTGGKSYTGQQIADEIKKETEFGKEQVGKLLSLTIDLVKRDKINQE